MPIGHTVQDLCTPPVDTAVLPALRLYPSYNRAEIGGL